MKLEKFPDWLSDISFSNTMFYGGRQCNDIVTAVGVHSGMK